MRDRTDARLDTLQSSWQFGAFASLGRERIKLGRAAYAPASSTLTYLGNG